MIRILPQVASLACHILNSTCKIGYGSVHTHLKAVKCNIIALNINFLLHCHSPPEFESEPRWHCRKRLLSAHQNVKFKKNILIFYNKFNFKSHLTSHIWPRMLGFDCQLIPGYKKTNNAEIVNQYPRRQKSIMLELEVSQYPRTTKCQCQVNHCVAKIISYDNHM